MSHYLREMESLLVEVLDHLERTGDQLIEYATLAAKLFGDIMDREHEMAAMMQHTEVQIDRLMDRLEAHERTEEALRAEVAALKSKPKKLPWFRRLLCKNDVSGCRFPVHQQQR